MSTHTTEYLHTIYKVCLESRALEHTLSDLWFEGNGRVVFSGVGSESTGAAVATLLGKDDYLIPRYRGFSALIGKGVPSEKIIAEMMGREHGSMRGIGGVTAFAFRNCRIPFYSINLGAMFSIVIGLGFALEHEDKNSIIVIFFGDGESTRTLFPASLNLAALWKLPILFVCENNGVSDQMKREEMSVVTRIASYASVHNIEHTSTTDQDPLELLEKIQQALNFVRAHRAPFFLEVVQNRLVPHSIGHEKKPQAVNRVSHEEDPLHKIYALLKQQGVNEEKPQVEIGRRHDCLKSTAEGLRTARFLSEDSFDALFYEE